MAFVKGSRSKDPLSPEGERARGSRVNLDRPRHERSLRKLLLGLGSPNVVRFEREERRLILGGQGKRQETRKPGGARKERGAFESRVGESCSQGLAVYGDPFPDEPSLRGAGGL